MPSSINKTNTGNPEWITPPHIIDLAQNSMGPIDCDPATFTAAQSVIQAPTFYTKTTNGLNKDWIGNIWLNPPYHISNTKQGDGIDAFAKKLLAELYNGHTTQAIFLAQSKTDTKWFQSLTAKADSVMFTRGRVKFVDASGVQGDSPGYGSVFFYFGNKKSKFIKEFSSIAYVI